MKEIATLWNVKIAFGMFMCSKNYAFYLLFQIKWEECESQNVIYHIVLGSVLPDLVQTLWFIFFSFSPVISKFAVCFIQPVQFTRVCFSPPNVTDSSRRRLLQQQDSFNRITMLRCSPSCLALGAPAEFFVSCEHVARAEQLHRTASTLSSEEAAASPTHTTGIAHI
jgi:hypothetical protein